MRVENELVVSVVVCGRYGVDGPNFKGGLFGCTWFNLHRFRFGGGCVSANTVSSSFAALAVVTLRTATAATSLLLQTKNRG